MATAEQIKSLIKSHFSNDRERFYTAALRLAAHEAGQGHGALAHEIRELIDKARRDEKIVRRELPRDMHGLILSSDSETTGAALVMPSTLRDRIERIIHEYRQKEILKTYSLAHRRKILLIGPSGTGKTMTAQVLAHELRLPIHTIQVDRLVTKFMGESSAKLRLIFELIKLEVAVYLFDEFDAIGGERSLENDVGEMRRVLNAFLQFIEQDKSDSLIVAASNSPKLLDRALFRRFDDVLYYDKPNTEERKRLIKNVIDQFLPPKVAWRIILSESEGLSHAEIDQACRDAIKQALLKEKRKVDVPLLRQMLKERQNAHIGRRG